MSDRTCWIVLGDIHDKVARLAHIPELPEAEGLLVTGDLTFAGGIPEATPVVEALKALGKPLLALPGNMDSPAVAGWLDEQNLGLHRKMRRLPSGLACLGLGFSPPTPFGTPGEFPDATLGQWLDEDRAAHADALSGNSGPWVLVSHTPPHNTLCDRITSGPHVGSAAVRAFIERHQPDLCLCGHIHESAALDTLGRTTIANPGAFAEGGYALLWQTPAHPGLRLDIELKRL
jgi:Predicted phosphoesterases, related to the Icc protein